VSLASGADAVSDDYSTDYKCTCGHCLGHAQGTGPGPRDALRDAQRANRELCERWNDEREAERRRNHHEVMCLVLKDLLKTDFSDTRTFGKVDDVAQYHMKLARLYADLAYPPPSAAPEMTTREVCDALEAERAAKAPPWPSMDDVK
jgi:hypothetical protein